MGIDTKLLYHLVDVVWGDALEDKSVPATAHAATLIAKANKRLNKEPVAPPTEEEDLNLANMEKRLIVKALVKFGGHMVDSAKALGISEPTLRTRMEAAGIKGRDFKGDEKDYNKYTNSEYLGKH